MKKLSHSVYIVQKTVSHKAQCVHRLCLRNFIPHESISDIQVDESQLHTDPDVIDEPEIFHEETSQLTPTPAAVSFETEDSEKENPHIHRKKENLSHQGYHSHQQPTILYTRHLHFRCHHTTQS